MFLATCLVYGIKALTVLTQVLKSQYNDNVTIK